MGLDDRQINALIVGGVLLLFLFLGVMTLWHALRAGARPARRRGDGWVLSPSPGHLYAAAFFGLFVVMGIGLVANALGRPSGWLNSGTVMGVVLTLMFVAMSVWMFRLYSGWRIYFDGQGVAVRRYGGPARRYGWDELTGSSMHGGASLRMTSTGQFFHVRSPPQLVLEFGDAIVRVPSTLRGYADLLAFMDANGLGKAP